MKRTFWLSLLLILFLGILLCDTAGADNHQGKWGNLSWTLDDNGTLTISGSGKMKDFSPDEDKAAWKQYGKDIREIIIGNGITTISSQAFIDCDQATSVTIPESVTRIESQAFEGNNSLTSVTIPKNVSFIGDSAFAWCGKLTGIQVDERNPYYCSSDGVLYNKDKSALIICPMTKSSITIPKSVRTLGKVAFFHCRNLTEINLPEGLEAIPIQCFEGCSSLTSIIIPSSVSSIGFAAFDFCTNLTSVIITGKKTDIGYYAFGDPSPNLTIYGWNDSKAFVSNYGFPFVSLNDVAFFFLPADLTIISKESFQNTAADAVIIPKGVTQIIDNPFSGSNVKYIFGYYSSVARDFASKNGYTFIAINDVWITWMASH